MVLPHGDSVISEQYVWTVSWPLRKLTENPNSTKVVEFWEEINMLFKEYQATMQDVAYLSFAIIIRELMEWVQ